jgi:hypothetical protein
VTSVASRSVRISGARYESGGVAMRTGTRVENTRNETGFGAPGRAALPCTRFGPILAGPAGMVSAKVSGAVA